MKTKVKIYKPAKTAMQSGHAKTDHWVLEYISPTGRIPESLMGWVSSGDTLNQVKIKFKTQKEAITFAKNEGFDYSLSSARERRVKPRNYGDNFKYVEAE